jgi:hypothetical protein
MSEQRAAAPLQRVANHDQVDSIRTSLKLVFTPLELKDRDDIPLLLQGKK